jgi:hypothetical protein
MQLTKLAWRTLDVRSSKGLTNLLLDFFDISQPGRKARECACAAVLVMTLHKSLSLLGSS